VRAFSVVDGRSLKVVEEPPSVVVVTMVLVELEVVGAAWPSPLRALTTTPPRKIIEKRPISSPTRLSIDGPAGIGAGV
jgi:hypothetical protein